jgi:hypothetical protein
MERPGKIDRARDARPTPSHDNQRRADTAPLDSSPHSHNHCMPELAAPRFCSSTLAIVWLVFLTAAQNPVTPTTTVPPTPMAAAATAESIGRMVRPQVTDPSTLSLRQNDGLRAKAAGCTPEGWLPLREAAVVPASLGRSFGTRSNAANSPPARPPRTCGRPAYPGKIRPSRRGHRVIFSSDTELKHPSGGRISYLTPDRGLRTACRCPELRCRKLSWFRSCRADGPRSP